MKWIVLAASSLLLGGCLTTDYCHDVGMKWGEAKYRECRMIEMVTYPTARPAIDVYIR